MLRFARHFGRSPAELGAEHVRTFQLHLLQHQSTWSTFNQTVCALRFLYRVTLGRPDVVSVIPLGKVPQTLPAVLDSEDVARTTWPRPARHRTHAPRHRQCLRTPHQRDSSTSRSRTSTVGGWSSSSGRGRAARIGSSPCRNACSPNCGPTEKCFRPGTWLFPGVRPDQPLHCSRAKGCQHRCGVTPWVSFSFEVGAEFSIRTLTSERARTTPDRDLNSRRFGVITPWRAVSPSRPVLPVGQSRSRPSPRGMVVLVSGVWSCGILIRPLGPVGPLGRSRRPVPGLLGRLGRGPTDGRDRSRRHCHLRPMGLPAASRRGPVGGGCRRPDCSLSVSAVRHVDLVLSVPSFSVPFVAERRRPVSSSKGGQRMAPVRTRPRL